MRWLYSVWDSRYVRWMYTVRVNRNVCWVYSIWAGRNAHWLHSVWADGNVRWLCDDSWNWATVRYKQTHKVYYSIPYEFLMSKPAAL